MLKINELYKNIIMEQSDEYDELDKVISFVSTSDGEQIQQKIEQSLESTLMEFQKEFPEFKNVKLYFDIDEFDYADVYAEVFPEDLTTIRINLFSFLQMCYYGQFSKSFSLDVMLDQIKNGTYEDMKDPLIAHELAHIADIKENGVPENDAHRQSFYDHLHRLVDDTLIIIKEEAHHTKIPSLLYHATYKPLLNNIKIKGLGNTQKTFWEDSKPGVVYLADDPNIAESYAEENYNCDEKWLDEIIVIQVDSNKLDHSRLFTDENVLLDDEETPHTYEYHGVIPWDNCEVIDI